MLLKWRLSGWLATCHNRLTKVWTVKSWHNTCFTRWEKNWKEFRIIFGGDTYTAILKKAFFQESVLNQNNYFKNTIQNLPTELNNIHKRTHTYFHFLNSFSPIQNNKRNTIWRVTWTLYMAVAERTKTLKSSHSYKETSWKHAEKLSHTVKL